MKYLGVMISGDEYMDKEVEQRIEWYQRRLEQLEVKCWQGKN